MNSYLLPIYSLTVRELIRFYRQRSRIIASLATPLVFWLLLGTGLSAAFPSEGGSGGYGGFVRYFYPANLVMVILFTSIFSTISIIEDRNEGFLQGVLVSPVSRKVIVAGKVLGGSIIGVFQGLLFLALAPFAGYEITFPHLALVICIMFVLALTMTSLGFVFAWRINSVQGFHAVMNLFLFPMWILSGTFFPASNAPTWLRGLMYCNPLFYGVSSLQGVLQRANPGFRSHGIFFGVVVTFLFGVVFYVVSTVEVNRSSTARASA